MWVQLVELTYGERSEKVILYEKLFEDLSPTT